MNRIMCGEVFSFIAWDFFNCMDPIITDKKSEAKTLLIGEYAILSGVQVYHTVI